MSSSLPIYVLCPAGARRDAALADLPSATALDGAEALESLADAEVPGLVLMDADTHEASALPALRALEGTGWVVALLDGSPDALEVRALSLDRPRSVEDVARYAEDPDAHPGGLLVLSRVVKEIARARHDVNNPLTSAMAETQLLLMEMEDGEAREAVEVIQTQLRRIRDLVAATRHLRPPRE